MIGYELNFVSNFIDSENKHSEYSDAIYEGQSQEDWINWFKIVIPQINESLNDDSSYVEFIMNEYLGTPEENDFNDNLETLTIETFEQFKNFWSLETQKLIDNIVEQKL